MDSEASYLELLSDMLGENKGDASSKSDANVPDDEFMSLLQDVMASEKDKPKAKPAHRDSTNYINLLDEMMGKLGEGPPAESSKPAKPQPKATATSATVSDDILDSMIASFESSSLPRQSMDADSLLDSLLGAGPAEPPKAAPAKKATADVSTDMLDAMLSEVESLATTGISAATAEAVDDLLLDLMGTSTRTSLAVDNRGPSTSDVDSLLDEMLGGGFAGPSTSKPSTAKLTPKPSADDDLLLAMINEVEQDMAPASKVSNAPPAQKAPAPAPAPVPSTSVDDIDDLLNSIASAPGARESEKPGLTTQDMDDLLSSVGPQAKKQPAVTPTKSGKFPVSNPAPVQPAGFQPKTTPVKVAAPDETDDLLDQLLSSPEKTTPKMQPKTLKAADSTDKLMADMLNRTGKKATPKAAPKQSPSQRVQPDLGSDLLDQMLSGYTPPAAPQAAGGNDVDSLLDSLLGPTASATPSRPAQPKVVPKPSENDSMLDDLLSGYTSPPPAAAPAARVAPRQPESSENDSLLEQMIEAAKSPGGAAPLQWTEAPTLAPPVRPSAAQPASGPRKLGAGENWAATQAANVRPKTESWEMLFREVEFKERLGQSPFGETWNIGYFKDRPVTLKKWKLGRSPNQEGYFDTELRTLMDLKHPNLAPVVGSINDRIFGTLELLVEGPSLHGWLRNPTIKRDDEWVLTAAKQIVAAMTYLHKKGVLHRSLHTHNIYVPHFTNFR